MKTDADKVNSLNRRKRKLRVNRQMASINPEKLVCLIPSSEAQITEFEVQSFIFTSLKSLGYTVRGELFTRCETCKFDLIIYRDKVPIRIIEVKRAVGTSKMRQGSPVKNPRLQMRKQLRRYGEFGVSVDLIEGMKNAVKYIEAVKVNGELPKPTYSKEVNPTKTGNQSFEGRLFKVRGYKRFGDKSLNPSDTNPVMSFGLFEGTALNLVPSGYLKWAMLNEELDDKLKSLFTSELSKRKLH